MKPFHRLGSYIIRHWLAIHLFFCFLGHLVCTLINVLRRRARIAWIGVIETLYQSGAKLALPIIIISALFTATMVINIHNFLGRFKLQLRAMHMLQHLITMDAIPFFIGAILIIQSSFSLMTLDKDGIHQQPQKMLERHIIPTMLGLSFSGVLLYIYILTIFWFITFTTITVYLEIPSTEFFLALLNSLTPFAMILALSKTFFYSLIASIILGYYYYQVSVHQISLRLALSRIISRGLLILALVSLLIKISLY